MNHCHCPRHETRHSDLSVGCDREREWDGKLPCPEGRWEFGEVELTQYLRPNGEPRPVRVELPADLVTKAAGMVLSCEVLLTEQVAIYGRYPDEDEDLEELRLASNGPGEVEPPAAVAQVIEAVWRHRHPEGAIP